MVSRAQVKANRRNAQGSTGPRSSMGKARAKLNARKHGLSRKLAIAPDDPDFCAATEIVAAEGFDPQSATDIVLALFEHRRVMETYRKLYLEDETTPNGPGGEAPVRGLREILEDVLDFVGTVDPSDREMLAMVPRSKAPTNADKFTQLERLSRYQRHAAAQLSKAIRNN